MTRQPSSLTARPARARGPRAHARGWIGCALLAGAAWLGLGPAHAAAQAAPDARACISARWQLWEDFRTHFVQPDGRVLDASTPKLHSSSESQSYAMFFALVANDPERFEQLWRWSVNNLAGGDMRQRLPAWIWGKDEQGKWRVLDQNSASDGDMWFVYALAEAARLWNRPDYLEDARALLALVETREIAQLPGFGPMLLPGENGFVQDGGVWLLNPSYLPIPIMRRLAALSPQGPWSEIATGTAALLEAGSPHGLATDWLAYRGWTQEGKPQGAFSTLPEKLDIGSYDAIRTYLWSGMTAPSDPLAKRVSAALRGMLGAVRRHGGPPEFIYALSGGTRGLGPFGFSAAVLPYLRANGATEDADRARARAEEGVRQSLAQAATQAPPYYDFMLSLFGLGWDQQRYRYDGAGRLQPSWENSCPNAATR